MDNDELLNMRFKICDNLQYEVNEEGIVTILEKQDHKIQRFFRKLKFKIPMYKRTSLDEYGSEVFLQINGTNTVKEIGEALEVRFGEKVHPLYERLLVFLNHIYLNCKYIEKVE
ncbi:PqqD family peptide modification chaperone [Clostridium perfringens]|uniref:PqqD family protein n=2 Tax=Clostridium perfringens TaxID=1502 RepID=A0AAP6WKF6_CLOPF|nr:PqqD family peptide modification chaperone [Clostridium perfringens]NGU28920.1 PqqD family protein [Clostridium perfringens]WEV03907.1 PqqD family peptide modification chaperone [Clostridium perfringens B]